MSTKIYHGYCLPRCATLDEAARPIAKFRLECAKTATSIYWQRIAAMAARMVDRMRVGVLIPYHERLRGKVENKFWSPFHSAFMTALDQMTADRNSKLRINSEFDFRCDVVLLYGYQKILALLFTEQAALTALWESQPFVEPYPYWDNTDPPDDMLEGEGYKRWKARGKEWEAALWNRDIPSLSGFTAECVPPHLDLPKVKDVVANLPKLAQRSSVIALDLADQEFSLKHRDDASADFDKFWRWLHSKEGKDRLRVLRDRARRKLKPRLIAADLQHRYSLEKA